MKAAGQLQGKECKQCKTWKVLSDFHKNSNGYRGTCKICLNNERRTKKLSRQSQQVACLRDLIVHTDILTFLTSSCRQNVKDLSVEESCKISSIQELLGACLLSPQDLELQKHQ